MSKLTDYTKLEASPRLVIAAQLGFTIRGFRGLINTRGSGAKVNALSITKDGAPVKDLYLGAGMDGFGVEWTEGDVKHQDHYSIQLRDDGAIKATPVEQAPEVTIPAEPSWQ